MSHLVIPALAAWLLVPPAVGRGEDKPLKVVATARDVSQGSRIGPLTVGRDGLAVVRTAEALAALAVKPDAAKDPAVQKDVAAEVAKLLKVEAIDWAKHMIVTGTAESVDGITSDGASLTVVYTRYKEPLTPSIPRSPKLVVLVERAEGEVKFVAKKEKTDPKP